MLSSSKNTNGFRKLGLLAAVFFAASTAQAGTIYITNGATNVTVNGATLNGSISSTCPITGWRFNYGTTTGYGTSTAVGGVAGGGDSRTATLGGLLCNTTYHYQFAGNGLNYCGSQVNGGDATFTTSPVGAPTSLSATAGDAQATVAWNAPSDTCGSAPTYTVEVIGDPSKTCTTAGTTCVVTGLTNGVAYAFKVTPTNGLGTGDVSGASNTVTPLGTQAALTASATPASIAFNGTSTLSTTGGSGTGAVTYAITAGNSFCSMSGNTVTGTGVGTCTVTATKATDGTYSAKTGTTDITVTQATQTISGLASSPTAGVVGSTATLTATGGGSGNAVTYTSGSSSVCTVSGNVVSFLSAGTCAIHANQTGNTNYSAAIQVTLNVMTAAAPVPPPDPTASECVDNSAVPRGFSVAPCVIDLRGNNSAATLNGIAATLGRVLGLNNVGFESQSTGGTVTMAFDGGRVAFLPLSTVEGDGRANGIYAAGNGKYTVVTGGIATTVAPGAANLNALSAFLVGSTIKVDEQGIIAVTNTAGETFVVQPSYLLQVGPQTSSSLFVDSNGLYRFNDASGVSQVFYPAFIEPNSLTRFVRLMDPVAAVDFQLNGTVNVTISGQAYVLTPDLMLGGIPQDHSMENYWTDGEGRYRMRNVGHLPTSQGLSYK